MTETHNKENDAALHALTALSEAAASTARDLDALAGDLSQMVRRREEGWTWLRIASTEQGLNPLSTVTKILADLGIAIGGFRRSLARALIGEGMKVTEIAGLLEVSRQRVSTLVGARREDVSIPERVETNGTNGSNGELPPEFSP